MKTKIVSILLTTTLFYCNSYAQNVGINPTGTPPNSSAGLDVDFTNKGLLIPRIALASATDAATIPSPATSLLVYNTGTGGLVPAGYYYNAGTPGSPNWVRLMPATGTGGAWLINGNAGTSAGTHFLGTTDAQDLVFKTNNVENMRILQSNGNVGIGTSTPINRLQVAGGGVRVGEINPPNTGTLPNYGRFLNFSGGPASSMYDSDNSDWLWIARYNVANDYTKLVVTIGDNINGDDAFSVQTSGYSSPIFEAYNNGNCYATNFVSTSDTTLKENISPLTYGLFEIMKIHPIFFNYKKLDNRRKRIGLIAQEIKNIMPELIDEKENLYVHYLDYTAVLTKAIQEQQQMIENLRKENEALKQELYQQNQKFSAELQKVKQHINMGEAKK